MNIMFIPDFRNSNSYQSNLSYSISKLGVTIHFNAGYRELPLSIIRHRPDILHIHWTYPFMISNNKIITIFMSTGFILELIVLRLFGIKIIWTVHNIIDHERQEFRSIEIFFTKLLARLCDKIIVHCHSAGIEVKNIYKKNLSSIVTIPHGNYIGQYQNNISKEEARNILNICKDDLVFLNFGQIRPYKGISELIDAFKKLKNENTKLLIVGKPLNDQISQEILENCKYNDNIKNYLKFIPNDDVQIYMNAADIVILPYKDILTSGTMILAMSFKRAIIAPEIGCIPDFLNDKGGFLYKNNFLDVMKKCINIDKKDLINMGEYNFRMVQKFGWDTIGKRTYELYRSLDVKPLNIK